MSDSALWIWFQLMFGIGTRRAHALMEYFENPGDIVAGIEKKSRVVTMLREEELLAWEKTLERAVELERRTLRKGCAIVTPDDEEYPPLLGDIYAKPAALYVKGDLSCLRDTLVIAMVGTRTYTEYGREAAARLAEDLAARGVVVVSGLAKGIDSICHEAALKAGGRSIGILGCGIDVDYPKGSAPLKRGLCENGAVVSEYPLGTEAFPGNFPLRNRVISGMADGVVVVEAGQQSGSMITAAHAAEQNRELFAVPGSVFSAGESGPHKLIKDGAKLTESVEDILEEFSHRVYPGLKPRPMNNSAGKGADKKERSSPPERDPEPAKAPKRGELPEGISEQARGIYALIGERPAGFDEIAAGSSLSTGEIQSALTELEIYGLIMGYPGRRFSL